MRRTIFNSLEFNAKNMELYSNGRKLDIQHVKVAKLLEANYAGKVSIAKVIVPEETPLYVCKRNFLTRESSLGKVFMDILLYNRALGIFDDRMYNRSLGHVNDVDEIEIHQVLNGKVMALISNTKDDYWGLFEKGDYFEIPPGWFHCTYILEDETVVANIYAHVSWEDDINKKPYFIIKNPYSLYKGDTDKKHILCENNEIKNVIKEGENIEGVLEYSSIPRKMFRISNLYGLSETIEDLFYRI